MVLSPSFRPLSVLSRMFGGAATVYEPRRGQPLLTAGGLGGSARPPRDLYDLLWAYYTSNSLYDDVTLALAVQGVQREALKPLRNPANRVVEFYVAKVWPGSLPDALPIEPENGNPRLTEAIHQVWQWSNWAAQKQVFVRKAAALGDAFVRVAVTTAADGTPLDTAQTRVYFQLIEPRHVADFATDERGYLTMIRVDIPQARRDPATGRVSERTHTEVWEKGTPADGGRVRVWEHTQGDEPDLEKLGPPLSDRPLADFGIDFVPFVHCLWRDVGEERGAGAYTHAVDKIDECNRVATRLHQQLYRSNDELWVLEGAGRIDEVGSIPPPRIDGALGSSSGDDGTGTVQVGNARYFAVPGGWTLTSKVPQLDYAASLNVANAMGRELEHDLPELIYARLQEEGTNLSGRAVRFLLAGAVDRALEARGNCEAALIRLNQMALTLGQVSGLPLFAPERIGSYARGDFAHAFTPRDVLPADGLEDAQAELARAQALKAKADAVRAAPDVLLREFGYDEAQIAELRAELDAAAPLPAVPAFPTAAGTAPALPTGMTVREMAQAMAAAGVTGAGGQNGTA